MAKFDSIDFKIINDEQLLRLFKELDIKYQKQIINRGIRAAAKPILDQAKANFDERKLNKSKTNYADVKTSFKIEPSRNPELIGVKVGVKYYDKTGRNNWYKYRWLEWGTNERFQAKRSRGYKVNGEGKRTGKITATHFFYDAVEARKEQAINDVQKTVVDALQKTVDKFNK